MIRVIVNYMYHQTGISGETFIPGTEQGSLGSWEGHSDAFSKMSASHRFIAVVIAVLDVGFIHFTAGSALGVGRIDVVILEEGPGRVGVSAVFFEQLLAFRRYRESTELFKFSRSFQGPVEDSRELAFELVAKVCYLAFFWNYLRERYEQDSPPGGVGSIAPARQFVSGYHELGGWFGR